MTKAHGPMKEIISLFSQSVEGYRRPELIRRPKIDAETLAGTIGFQNRAHNANSAFKTFDNHEHYVDEVRRNALNELFCLTYHKPGGSLCYLKVLCELHVRELTERKSPHLIHGVAYLVQIDTRSPIIILVSQNTIVGSLYSNRGNASRLERFAHIYTFAITALTLFTSSLLVTDPGRCTDSSYRADCLNPRRANLARINSQHKDVHSSEDQDCTRNRDHQVLLYPQPAALVPHPFHLNTQEHRSSLQAPRQHVQRAAA